MATGVITKYFEDRGFGFIRPDDGGGDLFFHVEGFVGLPWGMKPGEHDRVSFEIGNDPVNGRLRAQNLQLI
jgi:cold shock protein